MKIPKHPVGEREACWFHFTFALIGVAHVLMGVGMIWFHGVGAKRHYDDIDTDELGV